MPPLRLSSAKNKAKAIPPGLRERRDQFEDDAHFLRSWFERPLMTGSVTPSGKMLARMMASYVDPRVPGPIIEIGPGTGPVTEALIRRGIPEERLILVEFNPGFCARLRTRFPRATVVCGDAYRIKETLRGLIEVPCAAAVSSLPLMTKPMEVRLELLRAVHDLMHPSAPFVQFTYAVVPPIPAKLAGGNVKVTRSNQIWLNLPPARVWVYRRP